MLDEIHQRDLDNDLLSLVVKLLLLRQNTEESPFAAASATRTRLILMSATMQVGLFNVYFSAIAGQQLQELIASSTTIGTSIGSATPTG